MWFQTTEKILFTSIWIDKKSIVQKTFAHLFFKNTFGKHTKNVIKYFE